jgi:hypothetical protein
MQGPLVQAAPLAGLSGHCLLDVGSVRRYIRYPEQCRGAAQEPQNVAHRSLLLEIAKESRDLAESAATDRSPNKERGRTSGSK